MELTHWIIFILTAFFIYSIWKSKADKKCKLEKTSKTQIAAQKLADEVTTLQQLKSLERKSNNLCERANNLTSEKAYEKVNAEHDVYKEAVDIAYDKTFAWQFVPSLDPSIPKQVLVNAYKIFTNEEHAEIATKLSPNDYDWIAMDGYTEAETPEPELKAWIKFRSIVESDEDKSQIVKEINKWALNNPELTEEFLVADDDLSPGDVWFADALKHEGLPMAHALYAEGYDSKFRCLELDPSDFANRKGVGPKKVEQLKTFQENVRAELKT